MFEQKLDARLSAPHKIVRASVIYWMQPEVYSISSIRKHQMMLTMLAILPLLLYHSTNLLINSSVSRI